MDDADEPPVLDYTSRRPAERRSYWKFVCLGLLPLSTTFVLIAAGHGVAPAGIAMLFIVQGILVGDAWGDMPQDLLLATFFFFVAWLHLCFGTVVLSKRVAKALLTTGFTFLCGSLVLFARLSDTPALTFTFSLPTLAIATALLVQPFRRDLPPS